MPQQAVICEYVDGRADPATGGVARYLLTERLARPLASRALRDGLTDKQELPGVITRQFLAWLLGSGIPMSGIIMIGIVDLAADDASAEKLRIAMVVLGSTALVMGAASILRVAGLIADPLTQVKVALERVGAGHLDVRVPVYDGTEIGRLQLGFNEMIAGLVERERIRDTFGTYVDPAVAAHVLKSDMELEGEEVEVTVMFLDIQGFTA